MTSFSPRTSASVAFAAILLISFTTNEVGCLKLLKLSVPQYKLRGDNALLECKYDLEGDLLYSVKWYKDNEEFYRFEPKLVPPQLSYNVVGVKVDHSSSDSEKVTLRNVNLKSSGLYKCEASAEGPAFSSAQGEGVMEVFFLPMNGPVIVGEMKTYNPGDEINLNCTSGKSFPPSRLHWYINDMMVGDPRILRQYESIIHPHGLVSTTVGLSMTVRQNNFIEGSLKLKCVASISPLLWEEHQESVKQMVAPLIDKREAMFLVKGGAESLPRSLFTLVICLLLSLNLNLGIIH